MAGSIAHLLTSFHGECEREFAFLTSEFGFNKEFRVLDADQSASPFRTTPVEKTPSMFWAIERFIRGPVRIEIGYGDRELIVEGRYWHEDPDRAFGLWEIAEADNDKETRLRSASEVKCATALSKTISGMADALKQNISMFLEPRPGLFDHVSALREQRQRQAREQDRRRHLERARTLAMDEFRAKNYSRVITLLDPYVDVLTDADRKRIALSLKGMKAEIALGDMITTKT